MVGKVLPAVLARTSRQLRRQWHLAGEYGSMVHLDISDGTLVPGRTVGSAVLRQLDRRVPVELHCMTTRPDRWLGTMLHLRTQRVILHVEVGAQLKTYMAFVRSHRFQLSVAINPQTPLRRLWPWLSQVDAVQVMGVQPGRFGAPWQRLTIARIRAIHQRRPRLPISCDGGMTPATIPLVRRAGATTVITGSYLQEHEDPDRAWQELRRSVRALS